MVEVNIEFGAKIREEFYLLDKNIKFTNHGSYGAVPKPIYEKRQYLQLEMEKAPDAWFRVKSFNLWNMNRKALANYLNINDENLILSENATDAINSILKSTCEFLTHNDAILIHDYTYSAIANAVDYVSKYRTSNQNINVFKVECKYPIKSLNEILDAYDKKCEEIINNKGLKLKFVLLDHISSATAILFPIDNLIKIIRKWELKQNDKIMILIDGAHSIGQIKIDLNNIDCDYYVSNLHKWFLSPRGCAFLYFKDINDTNRLIPNVVSHGYNQNAIRNYFERATRDSTSWYLVSDCIDIYENKFGGLKSIEKYAIKLLDDAVKLLENGWGTSKIDMPKDIEAPFMKLIKLPDLKRYKYENDVDFKRAIGDILIDLYNKFNIISCIVPIQGELYCRISSFVYNDINDYIALRNAVLELKSTA